MHAITAARQRPSYADKMRPLMHTLTLTLAGLVLLALCVGAAKLTHSPSWTVQRAAQVCVPVGLLIAIGNLLIGMFTAGIPVLTELWVLVVVFGVPAAAAWYLRQSSAI